MIIYYTKEQLLKKYKDRYINTYAHTHTLYNDKINVYEVVFEVIGVSNKIKENFEEPKDIVERFC